MTNAAHWEEMSRRLAEQLCRTHQCMERLSGLHYLLDMELQRLDGCVSMIPDEIYPFHLWEKRHDTKPAASMLQTPQSDENADTEADQRASPENAPHGPQLHLPIT